MKKKILAIFIILACMIMPTRLYAEDSNTTEEPTTILDEQTPEKGAKKSQNSMTIPLLAITFGILGAYWYRTKIKQDVDLQVNSAYRNDDGSFTVSLGYKNPNKEKIHIETNKVHVTHGTAIILKNEDIQSLEPGKHEDVITAVINEDTNLNWNINEKSISIDGNKILKKGR